MTKQLRTTRIRIDVTPRGTVIIDVDGHELSDLVDLCVGIGERPEITVNGQPGAVATRTWAIGPDRAYGCQLMFGPEDDGQC